MALVMLIDDHPEMRRVLAQLLEMYGHLVNSFESGESALESLHNEMPDAMIVDDRMSGMTGVEVVRQVRENPRWTHLWVVLCSADSTAGTVAREAGADEFWVKGGDDLFERAGRLTQKLALAARASNSINAAPAAGQEAG